MGCMMDELDKKKAFAALTTAIAAGVLAGWNAISSASTETAKASYDTLAAANNEQSVRIKRLESVVSILLIKSGQDTSDVSELLGDPDGTIKIFKLLDGTSMHAPVSESINVADAGVPLAEVAADLAEAAAAPAANLPSFEALSSQKDLEL